MRSFVIATAMIALAAIPCAWDMDPRETPPIAALFADHPAPQDLIPKGQDHEAL